MFVFVLASDILRELFVFSFSCVLLAFTPICIFRPDRLLLVSASFPFSVSVLGDIMVLIGCIFYGCSNVGQEYVVKNVSDFPFSILSSLFL